MRQTHYDIFDKMVKKTLTLISAQVDDPVKGEVLRQIDGQNFWLIKRLVKSQVFEGELWTE